MAARAAWPLPWMPGSMEVKVPLLFTWKGSGSWGSALDICSVLWPTATAPDFGEKLLAP